MVKDGVQPNDPEWLKLAWAEVGVRETQGSRSTPRVVEYLKTVGHSNDAVAWCSAFVNWVFAQLGVSGTKSAMARSWQSWGMRLKEPRRGCIVVFWRSSRSGSLGHVGFYLGRDRGMIRVLGGNQTNAVTSDSLYHPDRVLAYIWPTYAATGATGAGIPLHTKKQLQPAMAALYVAAVAGILYKVRNENTTTILT